MYGYKYIHAYTYILTYTNMYSYIHIHYTHTHTHIHSCFVTIKKKNATELSGEVSDLVTKLPWQDNAKATASGISVAPYTGARFSHIPMIHRFRAIKDYNLFGIYLVLETFKNEFDIFIRLKVIDQSLVQLQSLIKYPVWKEAHGHAWSRPAACKCSLVCHSLVLEA
jgi:hypothetical protein